MDYQTYLASIGCAPAEVEKIITRPAQFDPGERVRVGNGAGVSMRKA
jgi:hypothetical protein